MLRFRYRMTPRRMSKASGRLPDGHGTGPEGRILKLRKLVTALVRHERIEGVYNYLDESRGYTELLIQEAIKNGDTHKPTMEIADYWLMEKDLVHKLFKVLVPRYSEYNTSVTKMQRLPTVVPGRSGKNMGVLELKGNPWPPIEPKPRDIHNNLVNILLEEARKDYRKEKYEQFVRGLDTDDDVLQSSDAVQNTLADEMDNLHINEKSKGKDSLPKDGTPV